MKHNFRKLLTIITCIILLTLFMGKNLFIANAAVNISYYISPTLGLDTYNGTSIETPFKTVKKAVEKARPGDTVYFMNGVYLPEDKWNPSVYLKPENSGTSNAFITYKAYPGHKPLIRAYKDIFTSSDYDSVWALFKIEGASYIKIEGLELEGASSKLTYSDANNCYLEFANGVNPKTYKAALYNMSGIEVSPKRMGEPVTVGGNNTPSANDINPHHIVIRNCVVHHMPGSGISAIESDTIVLEDNIVHSNSWYTMYGTSGISFLNQQSLDTNTTSYKNRITGNIVYHNQTRIKWFKNGGNQDTLSDGNGIIIDSNNNKAIIGKPQYKGEYTGKTYIANNIVFENGGCGINVFASKNVDVFNNTVYNNLKTDYLRTQGWRDLMINNTDKINVYNNIIYACSGAASMSNILSVNINLQSKNNLYFNATNTSLQSGEIIKNPKFKTIPTYSGSSTIAGMNDHITSKYNIIYDFSVNIDSSAIDGGIWNYLVTDIDKVARPQGAAIDIGAYEQ